MRTSTLVSSIASAAGAFAQTYTLTGCHTHGHVEYCFRPNGSEIPFTTFTSAPSSTLAATISAVATATSTADTPAVPIAVTSCYLHNMAQLCLAGSMEYEVITEIDTALAPGSYEGCHAHDDELHCTVRGLDVTLVQVATAETDHDHDKEESETSSAETAEGLSCHSPAGVDHCVDADGNAVDMSCSRPGHDYKIGLRIGLLFVILVTSGMGVFIPVLIVRFSTIAMTHVAFVGLRQFGTGIIVSTAIIHLFTHAVIFFANECLTSIEYEATPGAIMLAGLFISFIIEYIVHRWAHNMEAKSQNKGPDTEALVAPLDIANEKSANTAPSARPLSSTNPDDVEDASTAAATAAETKEATLKVLMVELGIVFHSILIGVTLVVASDSSFIVLFIVILFHQMFEGIALGTLIAPARISFLKKNLMSLAFAVTTPIGMAIGIGVLSQFNDNDPATIIAIGAINAFSAGVLLWVGLVEMWYGEWMHGPLAKARWVKTAVGLGGLVTGLVVMSLLGKWA